MFCVQVLAIKKGQSLAQRSHDHVLPTSIASMEKKGIKFPDPFQDVSKGEKPGDTTLWDN